MYLYYKSSLIKQCYLFENMLTFLKFGCIIVMYYYPEVHCLV